MGFIDRPQRLWWRKLTFQIHLWVGVALCLYMLVIGVTGSILVFESDLERLAYPNLYGSSATLPTAKVAEEFPAIVEAVRKSHPGYDLSVTYVPERAGENFEAFVFAQNHTRYVFVNPISARVVGEVDPEHSWLVWIINLHFRLLAGPIGLMLNGVGAIALLLLCVSGIVVWWPGVQRWRRALMVSFRGSWKRANFDLHSAIGFWTLLFVVMWACSGIYFVWPRFVESCVNRISSIVSAKPPEIAVVRPAGPKLADLSSMIAEAQRTSPGANFAGIFFPHGKRSALTVLMASREPRNFSYMDYVYFDPCSGKKLGVWHRGVNSTWGSSFIFWLGPLHFGYSWGLAVKIIWAILGCSIPILSITGVIMYWNRWLSKKWAHLVDSRRAA